MYWYLYPTIVVQADDQSKHTLWQDSVANAWKTMPTKAQQVANRLVGSITVVNPDDTRLNSGYTKSPRAALVDDNLIVSCTEDAEEIWHEIGHVIVDKGLTSEEHQVIGSFYKYSDSQQTPEEKLAEDFYFTVKGDKTSPFWQWWFTDDEVKSMRSVVADKIAKIKRTAGAGPLHVIEAVLDTFAEELVYDSGEEIYVWLYGIAKEALNDVQKEDRLSYENRSAPHQYYYTEDLTGPTDRPKTSREPLQVAQPDVTMRGK